MLTMADIERMEQNMNDTVAPGEDCVVSEETMRELLARAKAWERVLDSDTKTVATQEFGDAVVRITDEFNAAAAKGFRP